MAAAKATRPGFRQSLAATFSDTEKNGASPINLFHPIYHSYTSLDGSRIDIDRSWPVHLEDQDPEDLIDTFSEPPEFVERLSPVSVQFGDGVLTGNNWTELMIKVYRHSLDLFEGIGNYIESAMKQGRDPVEKVPFTSISIEPDTLHRIIEMDYETGESTYARLMSQFSQGIVAPCLTTPFHSLLPLLGDTEIRLCARISFTFYLPILKKYQEFLNRRGEGDLAVVPFWVPETAFHGRLERILHEEFKKFCKKEHLGIPHLVFLLDSDQTEHKEYDVLMKSWNLLEHNGRRSTNGSKQFKGSNGIHPAVEDSSVVFRDRVFSEWVVYANPSVKKVLDRTIAKVDSDLNQQGVHYGWAHFEDFESLAYSPRSVLNFKQKLVQLTELGYVPLSPDFYVRGKLRGQLGFARSEPMTVKVRDNSAGADWVPNSDTFARWEGLRKHDGNGTNRAAGKSHENLTVSEHRGYVRQTRNGNVEEEGFQCWKLGWSKVSATCWSSVVGNLDTCEGGMAEVLANFTGTKSAVVRQENVANFLHAYAYIYWREHFIQHDMSEADINVHRLANDHLRRKQKGRLKEKDAAIAGAAAQAIYFAMESKRSSATRHENMDQRAFFQNAVMLTLAMCDAVHVYHWLKDSKKSRRIVDMITAELIGFSGAFDRYDLSRWGVSRKSWDIAIESHIEESKENIVARAARRVAASQLRPLGYTHDFSREDELTPVSVGHLWTTELSNTNCCYENRYFCGVSEA